jgi:hypothetical protein
MISEMMNWDVVVRSLAVIFLYASTSGYTNSRAAEFTREQGKTVTRLGTKHIFGVATVQKMTLRSKNPQIG